MLGGGGIYDAIKDKQEKTRTSNHEKDIKDNIRDMFQSPVPGGPVFRLITVATCCRATHIIINIVGRLVRWFE